MAIEALIARYGLLAIFAGAGIEGEAIVLTGGVLAHEGLLPIWGVAAASAAGSCLVDQLWFWLARRYRDHRLVRAARCKPAFARALRLLERFPTAFILAFRFVYGLRTVSPIAIGSSTVPSRKFVPLNIVAAAIWGPAIAWAGFAFGRALDPWLREMKTVILVACAVALAGAMLFVLLRFGKAALDRRT